MDKINLLNKLKNKNGIEDILELFFYVINN